jgi:hypothetical protein
MTDQLNKIKAAALEAKALSDKATPQAQRCLENHFIFGPHGLVADTILKLVAALEKAIEQRNYWASYMVAELGMKHLPSDDRQIWDILTNESGSK